MTISVWYHTFGCKANQYDTERMRQELESRGASTSEVPESATAAVLNTCTVTDQADLSARRLIRKLGRRHPDLRIVVAGCSSALKAHEYAAMPEVGGVVEGQDPVAVALEVAPESALAARDLEPIGGVLLRANRRGSRGWMKIQDGCDRKCSFCATRIARGVSRSRPVDELVAEARLLAGSHAELVLTGVHIGHYGLDLAPGSSLSSLCRRLLDDVPGVRFRLGSIEATEIDDPLVELLEASSEFLAPHLHVPLQSGSDRVLQRMRRWHTREQYRRRVLEIANRVQPLGLGADIIVGFPGETEADHSLTRALVEELPYTYLHVFPYSVREGTAAADLPDRVPVHVAAERSRELREIGVSKGSAYAAGRAGTEALVAVETDTQGLTGDYLRVRVTGPAGPGSLVRARLSGAPSDLRAAAGATGRSALPVLAASAD
ncbi:MAG: MiaB/RimO family radical SAM methylthiotransferase [Gemmatimonadota bacterium]|jgi:threonylcarbamoyladenosine tRNA methylthiotransferase MtaB